MSRRLILGFATAAALFFLAMIAVRPWLAVGVLFISHMLVLYPTLTANCQWWGPVITHFETSERNVWLTIDDGPHPVHTSRMIEILGRFEAKATFFVIGSRAKSYPAEIEAIRAAGHELANHTATHPSGTFWCLPPRRIGKELDGCNVDSDFFRAPAGLKNWFVHPALRQRGMQLIGWSVRGLDTVVRSADAVADRICRRLQPGSIILLHEGHHLESDPDFHPRCLEATLRGLTKKGYRCVIPAPEVLRTPAGEKQKGDC